jgi:ribonuclease E
MKKEMLINVLQPEECRIAILEDGVLEELYVERTSHESYVGNIYKGRIVNIEPSIQAAFVDFGVGRNGFLHVSDVEPAYYRHLEQRRGDRGDRDRGEWGDRSGGRRGNGRGRERDRDRDRDRGGERPRQRPRGESIEDQLAADLEAMGSFEEPETDLETTFGSEGESIPETVIEPQEAVAEPPIEAVTFDTTDEPPAPTAEVEEESLAKAQRHKEVEVEPRADTPSVEPPPPQSAPESEPLTALPETMIEEKPARRRRSRGSSRRKRGQAAETPAEETPPPEGSSSEGGEAAAEQPRPRLMDSAERRTTERDSGPDAPHEVIAGQPSPTSAIDDDDIFFAPREARKPQPRPEPEPVFEPGEPEPIFDAEPVEFPERTERAGRGERHGRGGEPDRSSPPLPSAEHSDDVEHQLAEDLAGAGIDAEPAAEFETEFDENLDAEFDDDLPPPRPRSERRDDHRRGRDGGRDRGRGGRDRGRGGRDRGRGGRPGIGRPKPLIQDIFRRGQEVLVQVIKEGIGTKGPTLSTYISIAGRYLVLMPGLNRVGVSRKIADDEQRRRLREIFNELKPPRGLGFIIRTAGIDKNKKELQRDLAYLSRLWQVVVRRIRKLKSPAEIYQESDMITRTIRDTFTSDIDTIWVDEPGAFEHAQEFLQFVMPRYASRIKLYEGKEPLFHKYGIEDEIVRIQQRKVPLPMGGSIVIEQTEALVAIDVNSGNFRADNNAEETAYQMNLQAAKEIARQLRLRDLGGVIVNDFIDMREEGHRRGVEKAMRDAVRRDRARTKILKISAFGIIEMTRQRIRPSLKRSVYMDCPYCHGMAQVKTSESMSIEVMRMLQLAAHRDYVHHVEVRVTEEVANYLLNKKRREIARLEESGNIQVNITGTRGLPPETLEFGCYDNNNNEVKFLPAEEPVRGRR